MKETEQDRINKLKNEFKAADDRRRHEDIDKLLSMQEFRRILMHMVTTAGHYTRTTNLDPQHLAYQSGRRDIIHELMALCNVVSPEKVMTAQQERFREVSARTTQLK